MSDHDHAATELKFVTCDACQAQAGCPVVLCNGCLHNRRVIELLHGPVRPVAAPHALAFDDRILGSVVRKCWGTESLEARRQDGEFGVVIGIADHPTYLLVDSAGEKFSWAQSLTRPATAEETIEFWKERARKAESKLLGGK